MRNFVWIVGLMIQPSVYAQSVEQLWMKGFQIETLMQSGILFQDAKPKAAVDLREELMHLLKLAREMKRKHEPLRVALLELEKEKEGAREETALTKLSDTLSVGMPVQVRFANTLLDQTTGLLALLKPPVPEDEEAHKIFHAFHNEFYAAYKIPMPAKVPMWRGKPHPLAKYADYLPDRIEISFDQLLEYGVSDALADKIKDGLVKVRAYNSAMYQLHQVVHKLEQAIGIDEDEHK